VARLRQLLQSVLSFHRQVVTPALSLWTVSVPQAESQDAFSGLVSPDTLTVVKPQSQDDAAGSRSTVNQRRGGYA
jgi:hypothetical protein